MNRIVKQHFDITLNQTTHSLTKLTIYAGVALPAPLEAVDDAHIDVRAALLAARAAGLPVSVRNGGQDWVGRALRDRDLVLDLTPMRQCSVNVEALEATISGGVTVTDLNAAAGRLGLAAVIGNDAAVSMAGLLLGGGYGPLMTRFGQPDLR